MMQTLDQLFRGLPIRLEIISSVKAEQLADDEGARGNNPWMSSDDIKMLPAVCCL